VHHAHSAVTRVRCGRRSQDRDDQRHRFSSHAR
jgi:hypothetical protein